MKWKFLIICVIIFGVISLVLIKADVLSFNILGLSINEESVNGQKLEEVDMGALGFGKEDVLKYLHSDVGLTHSCSYYLAENPTQLSVSAKSNKNKPKIKNFVENKGKIKKGTDRWEVFDDLSGKYVPVDNKEFEFMPGEQKKIRFCAGHSFATGADADGAAAKVEIDHIPQFMGFDYSEMTWWNVSWLYKKPIIVNTSTNLTGYQLYLNVSFVSGKMNPDFSDLRFTNGLDSAVLPFWIESSSASSSAIVWIKGNFTTANGTQMYMYYGNSSAVTTTSNENTTFEFFDHFSGSSLNASRWTIVRQDTNIVISVANSVLTIYKSASDGAYRSYGIRSNVTYAPGYAVDFLANWSTASGDCAAGQARLKQGFWNGVNRGGTNPYSSSFDNFTVIGPSGANDGQSHDSQLNGVGNGTALTFGTSTTVKTVSYRVNETKAFNQYVFANNFTYPAYRVPQISLYAAFIGDGGDCWAPGGITAFKQITDWARVRKYSSPEPVASFGSEALPLLNITLTLSPSTASASTNVSISGNVSDMSVSGNPSVVNNPINIYLNNSLLNSSNLVADNVHSPGWWNYNWSYRKALNISRSSGAVTNFQVKLNVSRTTGTDSGNTVFVGTNCQADYDDLRFTNSTGTLLDYWIESTDSTTATVWIEFGSIGTTNTTFYMYYGNSGASAYSNGTNTFIFFDDFSGTLGGKWSSAGSPTIIGGALNLEAGDSVSSLINITGPARIEWSAYTVSVPGTNAGIGDGLTFPWIGGTALIQGYYYNSGGTFYRIVEYPGPVYNAAAGTEAAGNTYNYSFFTNGTTAQIWRDGVLKHTRTLTAQTGVSGRLDFYTSQAGNYTLDNIRARKYLAVEPTFGTWGAENSLLQTDSSGNYNYTFTAPAITGIYPVKVNSTYLGVYGANEANLTVTPCGAPAINSNWTVSWADNCSISTDVNLGIGYLILSGAERGTFTLKEGANITVRKRILNPATGSKFILEPGAKFKYV